MPQFLNFTNDFVSYKKDRKIESIMPDAPALLDGAEDFDTLCPVSKLTGHRTNPLTLLKLATFENSRLLDTLLQELPSIQEIEGISDDERMSMLASRLDTGTLAEQDRLVKSLESIADTLFPKQVVEQVKESVSDTIEFDKSDSNVSAE